MRRFLNVKTLAVGLVALVAVLAVYPDVIRYLPYLILAACPLSMLFMHRHGGHGDHASKTSSQELGEYVCPMHVEVRSTFPGRCPICSMALERTSPVSAKGGGQNGAHSHEHYAARLR
jgi:hypothetical protein